MVMGPGHWTRPTAFIPRQLQSVIYLANLLRRHDGRRATAFYNPATVTEDTQFLRSFCTPPGWIGITSVDHADPTYGVPASAKSPTWVLVFAVLERSFKELCHWGTVYGTNFPAAYKQILFCGLGPELIKV